MNNEFLNQPNAFEFTCVTCKESFVIHFDELIKDSSIICPNCKQKMDPAISEKLQVAVTNILDALDMLASSGHEAILLESPKCDCGFRLKIRWNDMQPEIMKRD